LPRFLIGYVIPMENKKLTQIRKQILVHWYLTHKKAYVWPTLREAAEVFHVSHPAILHHVKIMEDMGLMQTYGRTIALTPAAIEMLSDSEKIALGLKGKLRTDDIKRRKFLYRLTRGSKEEDRQKRTMRILSKKKNEKRKT